MITKERLQELITLNKPFWYVYDNSILQTINAKYWKIVDDKICWYADSSLYRPFENLFENKEEAEWYLEFGNIQRTETLSLPTWEEIKESCDTFFSDYKYLGFITPLNIIVINKYGNGGSESFIKTLFKKPLTKENYIKACEIAKKLFLGEEG